MTLGSLGARNWCFLLKIGGKAERLKRKHPCNVLFRGLQGCQHQSLIICLVVAVVLANLNLAFHLRAGLFSLRQVYGEHAVLYLGCNL